VHERNLDSDFLLIILRDLLPKRADLRLVLMSATMNADQFAAYARARPRIPAHVRPRVRERGVRACVCVCDWPARSAAVIAVCEIA
jgi:hypothetical protein